MSRRFRPTDAFVDESIRGQRYLMGCVLIEARHLADVRPAVAALGIDGTRVHFNNESNRQKTRVLSTIASMPLRAIVTICYRDHGVTEYRARADCLTALVTELQQRAVGRLVIESRQDDHEDELLIRRVRANGPQLVFEHRLGVGEPLLWVADALTWAVGADHRWRVQVDQLLDTVIELRP